MPKTFLNIDTQFSSKRVPIEFEMIIHKAVEVVRPKVEVVGCRFHLRLVAKCTILWTIHRL